MRTLGETAWLTTTPATDVLLFAGRARAHAHGGDGVAARLR